MNARESLLGRHGDVWSYHSDIPSFQAQRYGLHLLANALSIAGLALDEEGAVGSQSGSIAYHLLIAQSQLEHLVQQRNHVGTIARTTTHTSLRGNSLPKVRVNSGQSRAVLFQQFVCPHHQVPLLVALNHDVRHFQVAIHV